MIESAAWLPVGAMDKWIAHQDILSSISNEVGSRIIIQWMQTDR
jgi:hypothetical protein